MKKIISILVLSVAIAAPAHAINAKYREQLMRSGCTMTSEPQGCDIHKTKAQNEAAGFRSGVAPTIQADVKKFDGNYVARHTNGQHVASIHIGAGRAKIDGKNVKATVSGDMLILNASKTLTYVIYNGAGSFWEDTDSGNRGTVSRVRHY